MQYKRISSLIGGRVLGCGSGKMVSLITDVSLGVREWYGLFLDISLLNSLCEWSSFVILLSWIDSGRLSGIFLLLFKQFSLCLRSKLLETEVFMSISFDFIIILLFIARFGEDIWKFWRIKLESLELTLESAPMHLLCELDSFVEQIFSGFSGIEFWLGGLGAIRFLRFGTIGTPLLFTRWFIIIPEESVEFNEFVELYGETEDIVCGRAIKRFSRLKLECMRYLTVVSSLIVFGTSFISLKPTSPTVKLKLYTWLSSAKKDHKFNLS